MAPSECRLILHLRSLGTTLKAYNFFRGGGGFLRLQSDRIMISDSDDMISFMLFKMPFSDAININE